ncbi:MAG: Nif3-like dinuclear metal center hexameric protein [Bacillota bacterium]|nr:Nif3-like dinuclear metal center hexameric protein [Bacillota bacterium]
MKEKVTTVNNIVEMIETIAPRELQEDWDNSGLIIGFKERQVSRILTCLEINTEVVEEAIGKGVEMIISHHPLIFGGISNLSADTPQGAAIIRLIRHGISVYSCHTPFDKAPGGNNDALAGIMELKDITTLDGEPVLTADEMVKNPSEMHIGRMGKLKRKLRFSQVIDFVCEGLGLEPSMIRVVGDLDTEIIKIGICTGAGAEFAGAVRAQGCDAFITGDLKYHQAQDAKDMGLCIIDGGHYGTEKIFPAVIKIQLEKMVDKRVDIVASEIDLDPFNHLQTNQVVL